MDDFIILLFAVDFSLCAALIMLLAITDAANNKK